MAKRGRFIQIMSLGLAVCLGCLAMAGCSQGGESGAKLTEIFENLLAEDFEAYYLFYSGGLPVNTASTTQVEGTLYQQVSSSKYTSLESLKRLLEGVYAQEADRNTYLARTDGQGKPLLREVEGKLYYSAQGEIMALRYEMVEDTLKLEQKEAEKVTFTFEETGLDGSLYRCAMSMSKTSKGWRLDSTRANGQRTVLREGSGQSELAGDGAARGAAEQFLAALLAGDGDKIAQLAGVPPDAYQGWSRVKVSAAAIAATTEEMDSYGDYLVKLVVEDGAGILENGENNYRLLTGFLAYGDTVGPLYFQPAAKEHYNHLPHDRQTNAAANMVRDYLGFFPAEAFENTQEIPKETVTEYCLIRLSQNAGAEAVFTVKQVQEKAQEDFGLENFDGTGTPFYSKDAGGYLLYGRGGYVTNLLLEPPEEQGKTARVRARLYSDPLCTQDEKVLVFELAKNTGESWRLVSAKWQ